MNFDPRSAPFALSASEVERIEALLAGLSQDQKLRQLFNLMVGERVPGSVEKAAEFGPGSVTLLASADADADRARIARIAAGAVTPLLVSADVEGGALSFPGLDAPNPLALAAVDDVNLTRDVTRAMARAARARGIRWTFTPLLDIGAAFRSAIIGTRGFGSDPARIARHALAQIEAFQAEGIAATVKHWPGEGFDDRDQHLVTTVNPLDTEEWRRGFGALYARAIGAGVMSVMSAHIALPDYARSKGAKGVEAFRPASASGQLTRSLLREELGFNGLVVSDATPMAGLGSWSARAEHLPEVVAAGCDVILFSHDPEADLEHLRAALTDGRLSWARIDEALRAQFAMKSALGLFGETARPDDDICPELAAALAEAHRRAPTLVKDVNGLLPLSPDRHRRLAVLTPGIIHPAMPRPLPFSLPAMLATKGFEVTELGPDDPLDPAALDAGLYVFGEEDLLARGHIFIDWLRLRGNLLLAMERRWNEVPTLMISFGHPYLLYDAPRVPAYVNAYTATETMQGVVAEAITGDWDWNRASPVDPFCGLGDAAF